MVKVITVVTHSEAYFPFLKQSCSRFNTELVILGHNEKWKGFSWRFHLIKNYLKTLTTNELICIVDGYDMLLLRDVATIEKDFNNILKNTNMKIIFGYDFVSNKYGEMLNDFYFKKCDGYKLNAGVYISYSTDLINIIDKLKYTYKDDDQVLLTKYCINNKQDIYIDTPRKFIVSILNPNNDILNDKNICIKNTNNKKKLFYKNEQPYFLHAPGCTSLHQILVQLDYDMDDQEAILINKYLKKTLYNKYMFYAKNLIQRHSIYVVFFILVVLLVVCTKKTQSTIYRSHF
jgi:hypothetical protein